MPTQQRPLEQEAAETFASNTHLLHFVSQSHFNLKVAMSMRIQQKKKKRKGNPKEWLVILTALFDVRVRRELAFFLTI